MSVLPEGIVLVAILFLIGFLLIVAEAFIPGMIAGIVGGLFLIAAVVAVYVYYGAIVGVFAAFGLGILTLIGFFVWLHLFPKTFMGKKLMLQTVQTGTASAGATERVSVGDAGRTVTPLRPSGSARIGNQRIDVTALAEFLEEGVEVEVVSADGLRVVVRRKDKLELNEDDV